MKYLVFPIDQRTKKVVLELLSCFDNKEHADEAQSFCQKSNMQCLVVPIELHEDFTTWGKHFRSKLKADMMQGASPKSNRREPPQPEIIHKRRKKK